MGDAGSMLGDPPAIRGVTVRVLIVDDTAAVRYGLRRALAMEGYVVSVAADGGEAMHLIAAERPDVVVLDVVMPHINGLDLCRSLRLAGDRTPVLMLTVCDRVGDRVSALDAGADDHLGKPFALEELLARVRALIRRAVPAGEEPLAYGEVRVDPSTREAWSGEEHLVLSATEFDLLALFLAHPRHVLRRRTITEHVWGHDLGPASNLLAVYVGYLRRKLERDGRPRLIHTVRGIGYVLRDP
jgi:two-component system response regulator MprA